MSSSSSWLRSLDVADVVPDVVPRPNRHNSQPPPARLRRRSFAPGARRNQLVDGLAGEQEDGAGMVRVVDAVDVAEQRRGRLGRGRGRGAGVGRGGVEGGKQLGEPMSCHAARVATDLRRVVHPHLRAHDATRHFLAVEGAMFGVSTVNDAIYDVKCFRNFRAQYLKVGN